MPSPMESLRAELHDSVRAGTAMWISLDGLSLANGEGHRALTRSLVRFGLGGDADGAACPNTVVLDWTRVATTSAEAIAYFAVLLQCFRALGVRIYVGLPSRRDVAEVLAMVAGRDLELATCVTNPVAGTAGIRRLAHASVFSESNRGALGGMFAELSGALRVLTPVIETRRRIESLVSEAVSNVFAHAGAAHASVVVLLQHRRRPRVVQVGIADDGKGIPMAMLEQAQHAGLGAFHDASLVGAVLRRGLTRRAAGDDGEADNRGGLGSMLSHMRTETDITVRLRSGAALVVLPKGTGDRVEKTWLDYGLGSQLCVEFAL